MIVRTPTPRYGAHLAGLGDCLTLGYELGGKPMCRDNNSGSVIDCGSAACEAKGTYVPPGGPAVETWQQYGTGCTPRQYSFLDPAPWPPKDPCIIQNAVPCLPADWPRRNSGYYDGDPGVSECDAYAGPTSFGIPVAAYSGPPVRVDVPGVYTPPPPAQFQPSPVSVSPSTAPPSYSTIAPAPAPAQIWTQQPPVDSRYVIVDSNGNTMLSGPREVVQQSSTPFVTAPMLSWVKDNWILLAAAGAGLFLLKGR